MSCAPQNLLPCKPLSCTLLAASDLGDFKAAVKTCCLVRVICDTTEGVASYTLLLQWAV